MKKILMALLLSSAALASAQTYEELLNNKNTDNVVNFGMGPKLQMHSALGQINKSNVRRLVPVWSTSTMSETGELGQPVVYNGVMYTVNFPCQ